MSHASAPAARSRPRPAARPTAQHKSRQVALGLREMVRDLTTGDRLPSIAHLERHFGVSTGTVEAAIRELREEGLLVARRGSGVFVAEAGGIAPGGMPPARPPVPATQTLAVIAPANMDFFRFCVEALTEQAALRGRKVVCHYLPQDEDFERRRDDVLHLEALDPAGFLIFSHRLARIAAALRGRGHRTALIGALPLEETPPEGVPCIYGDQERGAFLAVEHLLSLGHRRIGCTERFFRSRRLRGAERAVARVLGRSAVASDVLRPVLIDWDSLPAGASADCHPVWRERPRGEDAPTALFPWSDSHALRTLHALARLGVDVPGRVSLISYDALPLGAQFRPALTSVDQHVETQIAHALDVLDAPPTGGGHVPLIAVTPTLVVRESTAAPPPT